MSSAHVTYSSHPSATSENEITALAAVYKLCLERSQVNKDLIGKQFTGQVTHTRTGSRNKVEHGTVGPVSSGATEEAKTTPKPHSGDDEDDMFADLPF